MYNVTHNVINNVKLSKVGSDAIVPAPVGAGPNKLPCFIDRYA
jgi:hypothetical protein